MGTYVEPQRPKPYGTIYVAPVIPKEPKPTMPTMLPDDSQMVNFIRRLHIEGYQGELQRAGGIFETPDDSSLIRDARNPAVKIDDFSLSVWTGRYVRMFANQTTDHHERATRFVLGELHNSHEARSKRGELNQPTTPLPVGTVTSRLRVESGRLRNDAGWFNWQGVSAFCHIGHVLQGRAGEMTRQTQANAAAGRNLQRVFCMLRPVNGNFGPVETFHPDVPGWLEAAQVVVAEGASFGMYTQLNIFADCSPQFGPPLYLTREDRFRILRLVALAFKDNPAVVFRLANEPYQNGWSGADDRELLDLADELASILGHRDFAIGDVPDSGSESGSEETRRAIRTVAEHGRILVSHPDRAESDGRERPIEHLKSVYEYVHDDAPGAALVFDEPRGFASQRQPGRRDNRPAVAVAEACTAAVLGCGYTYHRIAEQDDATPGMAEARVALQIPTDPAFRYENAGLGGSWVEGFSGFYKVRTCSNNAIGFAIGHGPNGSLVARREWNDPTVVATLTSDGLTVTLYRSTRR